MDARADAHGKRPAPNHLLTQPPLVVKFTSTDSATVTSDEGFVAAIEELS